MSKKTHIYVDDGVRYAGVLAHPTSFPSPYGIGDLGQGAYDFIDFLEAAGQTLWQVLPLGPTGLGNSPYSSFSSFAGQSLLISPDKLVEAGLLTREEIDSVELPEIDPLKVDYDTVLPYKKALMKMAYANFKAQNGFTMSGHYFTFYLKNKFWLDDYAFFMACKDYHNGARFMEWTDGLNSPNAESRAKYTILLNDKIRYYMFLQYVFYTQWDELHAYANSKHIRIIGDLPIFAALDSADVWANSKYFKLDSKGYPTVVSGVPPDYFSEDGQLWGNPLYDWDAMKKDNYAWWISRIKQQLRLVDMLRIDHFRGFAAAWTIPADSTSAKNGTWIPSPGVEIFNALTEAFNGNLPIIAEDLGIITEDVTALRDRFGLPGMKVLQFGFENLYENNFLPHQFKSPNFVCYSGTHDNNTTIGWYKLSSPVVQDKVRRYCNTNDYGVAWNMVRLCLGSIAKYAVYPMQDLMGLGEEARMNVPGVALGNWSWRFDQGALNEGTITALRGITELFGRVPETSVLPEDR